MLFDSIIFDHGFSNSGREAWYELSPKVMQNLGLSMENRVFEEVKDNGNPIKC